MIDTIAFTDGGAPRAWTAGDFNADGVVGAVDYTIWRDALGDAQEVVIIITGAQDGGDSILFMQGADDGQWRIGGFSDVSGLNAEISLFDADDAAALMRGFTDGADYCVWRGSAIADDVSIEGPVREWWDALADDAYLKLPDIAGES